MPAALALGLCLPAGASAADTVLGFDDIPAGVRLAAQYHDKGVDFAITPSGEPTASRPEVVDVGAQAHSGTHAVDLDNCDHEFCFNGLDGTFAYSHSAVRVYAGTAPGRGGGDVTLVARDANGAVVGTNVVHVAAGSPATNLLEVTSPTSNIVYFELSGPGIVDDFSYDTPLSPPPPDFGLAIDTTGNFNLDGDVGVLPGDSTTVKIAVNRFNGAQGNLKFTASGLPAGVTSSFAPSDLAGTPSVTLNLSAAQNAGKSSGDVTIDAAPQSAQAGSQSHHVVIHVVVLGRFDIRVTGIEVTQGIQTEVQPCNSPASCKTNVSLPARSGANPTAPVAYSGVTLAEHGRTIARVFANVRTPKDSTVDGVQAVLHGFRNGKELPGSPLLAERGDMTLKNGRDAVSFLERTDPVGAYTFTLPPGWTAGVLTLRAEIVPPLAFIGTADSECEDAICGQNNTFTYSGIPFTHTDTLRVSAVRMWWTGEDPNSRLPGSVPGGLASNEGAQKFFPCPSDVFAQATNLMPTGEGQFDVPACDYDGTIDITALHLQTCEDPDDNPCDDPTKDGDDYKDGMGLDILEDWADDHPFCGKRSCADITAGINTLVARGISAHGAKINEGSNPMFVVDYGNTLNSVAHELFHGLGRPHASKGCGGDANGQVGEDWPPDGVGFIQGVGLDRRPGSGGTMAPYRIIAPGNYGAPNGVPDDPDDPKDPNDSFNPPNFPGTGAQPGDWYDFLSYCAGKGGAWISTKGWNDSIAVLEHATDLLSRAAPRAVTGSAAAGPSLNVRAIVEPDGHAFVTSVKPGVGRPLADASSPYRLVIRDAAGNQLAETGMVDDVQLNHDEPETHFLKAELPAGAAPARVQIVKDGVVLAERSRSAHAPKARFITPKARQLLGKKLEVAVTWKASDADGDRLRSKLDYSIDGGKSWTPIWLGLGSGKATMPARDLSASRHARLRLHVLDGFNEAIVLSPVFRSVGRPPSVAITSPAKDLKLTTRADATLVVSGVATDDRDRSLSGKRLRWYDGKRFLGTGTTLAINGLRPGKRTLRLRAKDAHGRVGTAKAVVRVTAVAPQFLEVRAPAKLSATAHKLTLRVSATVPAVLRAGLGRKRTIVDRHLRKVVVRIKPGSGPLTVKLRLAAGDLTAARGITIPRG